MKQFIASKVQFTGVRLALAITALCGGASFCLNDAWHKFPLFYYLNHLPIPWYVYGAALIIAALFLLVQEVRPVGYLIGAIVYTIFSSSALLALIGGWHLHVLFLSYLHFPTTSSSSYFGAGNLVTITVLYWSALRYAIYEQVNSVSDNTNAL